MLTAEERLNHNLDTLADGIANARKSRRMVVQRAPIARYDKVAEILARWARRSRGESAVCQTIERIAFDLADIYTLSDPGFSRTRFLRRAGIGL